MDSVKLTLTPDFMPNEQKQQNLLSNHNNSEVRKYLRKYCF